MFAIEQLNDVQAQLLDAKHEVLLFKASQPNPMKMGPPVRAGDKTKTFLNQYKHILVDFFAHCLQNPHDKNKQKLLNVGQYDDITNWESDGMSFGIPSDVFHKDRNRELLSILEDGLTSARIRCISKINSRNPHIWVCFWQEKAQLCGNLLRDVQHYLFNLRKVFGDGVEI